MPEALREAERRLRRFGLNEPAAGALARASHRVNLAVALAVALLPGLWTLLYNLVAWPNGISTLSNLCLSAQLVALAAVLAAHAVTFNICEYVPLRDWLEEYAGFLFLYRGRCVHPRPQPRPALRWRELTRAWRRRRAQMLVMIAALSFGNTQWDGTATQLILTLGGCLAAAAAAALSVAVHRRQPVTALALALSPLSDSRAQPPKLAACVGVGCDDGAAAGRGCGAAAEAATCWRPGRRAGGVAGAFGRARDRGRGRGAEAGAGAGAGAGLVGCAAREYACGAMTREKKAHPDPWHSQAHLRHEHCHRAGRQVSGIRPHIPQHDLHSIVLRVGRDRHQPAARRGL